MHHAEIPLKIRCYFTHPNRNRATNINGIYKCTVMFFHPQRNILKMQFVEEVSPQSVCIGQENPRCHAP